MDTLELFLQNNDLRAEDNMDALLELASLVRELLSAQKYEDVSRVVYYTVSQGCLEAFSWIMEILQEELAKADGEPLSFECRLGRAIPDFDAFIQELGVDFAALQNDVETVCDEHGEVDSFFNNLVYKTRFENIFLVSSENFDTKDNDSIQYKLVAAKSCRRLPENAGERLQIRAASFISFN